VLHQVDDEGKRLWYQRHQLQKVNTTNLVRTGMFGGKDDDNFGQGAFDLEEHLKTLGRARQEALLTEEEFEAKVEEEEEEGEIQVFDERDKLKVDDRRAKLVKQNLKKQKVVDRLKDQVPDELKDYFQDEAELEDKRPIAKRITRSQAKKSAPTLQDVQQQEQLVARFAKKKKDAEIKALAKTAQAVQKAVKKVVARKGAKKK
jgi:hypothetical protein